MKKVFKRILPYIAEILTLAAIAGPLAYFAFNNEQLINDYVNMDSRFVVMVTNAEGDSGGDRVLCSNEVRTKFCSY